MQNTGKHISKKYSLLKKLAQKGKITPEFVLRMAYGSEAYKDLVANMDDKKKELLNKPIDFRLSNPNEISSNTFGFYTPRGSQQQPEITLNQFYVNNPKSQEFPITLLAHEMIHYLDDASGEKSKPQDLTKRRRETHKAIQKTVRSKSQEDFTKNYTAVLKSHYGDAMADAILADKEHALSQEQVNYQLSSISNFLSGKEGNTGYAYSVNYQELNSRMTEFITEVSRFTGKMPKTQTDLEATMIVSGVVLPPSIKHKLKHDAAYKQTIFKSLGVKDGHELNNLRQEIRNSEIASGGAENHINAALKQFTPKQKEAFWKDAAPRIAQRTLEIQGMKQQVAQKRFKETQNTEVASLNKMLSQLHIDTSNKVDNKGKPALQRQAQKSLA